MSSPAPTVREPVRCRDRETGQVVDERIPKASILRWLYGTASGGLAADLLCSRHVFSRLTAWWSRRPGSCRQIEPFVRDYDVDLGAFEAETYGSFNDFFVRRFRPGVRPFCAGERLPAWAEGACLAWDRVQGTETFPVKGQFLTPAALLGGPERAAPFTGGPLLLIRLRPADYHRFHFADDGPVVERFAVPGRLHSVNMACLRMRPDILARNERHVTIQQSTTFGRLAYVEVGALLVGRIVQLPAQLPGRGDEKGYFEYGGSTVALFGEPGAWRADADLLQQTAAGMETLVRLGTPLATAGARS